MTGSGVGFFVYIGTMKLRSLLLTGVLIAACGAFATDADVGSNPKSEILVIDAPSFELSSYMVIEPMDFTVMELTVAEASAFEFSAWRPKGPAAMFTSPNYKPLKTVQATWRRARDGLRC